MWPIYLFNPRHKYYWMGRMLRFWTVLISVKLNPFWSVKTLNNPPKDIKKQRKVLIVCNHLTQADPWLVSAALGTIEAKWVFKKSLLNIPFYGRILRLSKDIPIPTKTKKQPTIDKAELMKSMNLIKDTDEKYSMPVLLFPEGTRGSASRLQPFKSGFFRFAIENNWQVLPMVSFNSQKLWPVGAIWMYPGTAYAKFGDLMKPYPSETVDEFKHRVRNVMCDLIRSMPGFDPNKDEPLPENNEFFAGHEAIIY